MAPQQDSTLGPRPWAWFVFFVCCCHLAVVSAFDSNRTDNLAVYWGQDSAGSQKSLAFYCDDDTIDAFPMAFLYIFFGENGMPVIDFANICSPSGDQTFPGTGLADCSFLSADIKKCQAKGKIVTLSIGGATARVGFASDTQAISFAKTIWDLFLGGNSPTRPFGNAVLDGVDLDIESGSPAHYSTFVNEIRSLAKGARKRFYVTAAPQCPFPDAKVGEALNQASFDAVYVQFYNNFCGLDQLTEFNFATWDNWAKHTSPNKNVKVYIGTPGSHNSAGTGFVPIDTLVRVAHDAQKRFSSFGGVMIWDASSSFSNNRYDAAIKKALVSGAKALAVTPQAE